jgi:hypothetical protein
MDCPYATCDPPEDDDLYSTGFDAEAEWDDEVDEDDEDHEDAGPPPPRCIACGWEVHGEDRWRWEQARLADGPVCWRCWDAVVERPRRQREEREERERQEEEDRRLFYEKPMSRWTSKDYAEYHLTRDMIQRRR